jgi:hypothetical protein
MLQRLRSHGESRRDRRPRDGRGHGSRACAAVERLESRRVLDSYGWGGGTGAWDDASNWYDQDTGGDGVPGPTDSAQIFSPDDVVQVTSGVTVGACYGGTISISSGGTMTVGANGTGTFNSLVSLGAGSKLVLNVSGGPGANSFGLVSDTPTSEIDVNSGDVQFPPVFNLTGTLNVATGAVLETPALTPGSEVSGTVNVASGGAATFHQVDIQGQIKLAPNSSFAAWDCTISGTIDAGQGSTCDLEGGVNLGTGAALLGSGTFALPASQVTVNGTGDPRHTDDLRNAHRADHDCADTGQRFARDLPWRELQHRRFTQCSH